MATKNKMDMKELQKLQQTVKKQIKVKEEMIVVSADNLRHSAPLALLSSFAGLSATIMGSKIRTGKIKSGFSILNGAIVGLSIAKQIMNKLKMRKTKRRLK